MPNPEDDQSAPKVATEAVEWVNSPEGQKKLKEAQEMAKASVAELKEARRVKAEKLRRWDDTPCGCPACMSRRGL